MARQRVDEAGDPIEDWDNGPGENGPSMTRKQARPAPIIASCPPCKKGDHAHHTAEFLRAGEHVDLVTRCRCFRCTSILRERA